MTGDEIRVLPLGGMSEIGMNMTAVEYDGAIAVVDAGLMFPSEEMLGIDLVLPDFSYLRDRADDVVAIALTHGHEDHVGALPYLLRDVTPGAIYGGPLTIALVRSKLDEHGIRDAELRPLDPGQRAEAGPFEIETVHLSHSIPDARAVVVRTPAGSVLVTGDYKLDQTPVDGRPADVARLAQLGDEGILLLCGDSTNSDRPGMTASESTVGPALEDVFSRCEGRVVVTTFASNLHRLQQVMDAAHVLDRKVAVVGRSMRKNLNIARSLGRIDIPAGLVVQPGEIDGYPDDRVVIVCTGSQGEPLSALRRMAHCDHRQIEIRDGDTVVFSATPIPGNERAVSETISRLYQIGAKVITPRQAAVHTSGHGSAEELKLMLNLTRPKYFMPVHGDPYRLHLHAELAEAVGIDPERIFIGRNGLPLDVSEKGASFGEPVEAGLIYVDGLGVGDVRDVALRDRRMLSADGVIIVVATVASDDGSTIRLPEVISRGVPFLGDEDELADEIANAVEAGIEASASAGGGAWDADDIQRTIHDEVSRLIYERRRLRPMVLPVVVEV